MPTYHKVEQITCVGFVITLRVISKVLSCFPLRDCFRLFLLERTFILSYNIGFGIPECKMLPWLIMWWERKTYSSWKLPVLQCLKTHIPMTCYEFSRNNLCKKNLNLPFVEVELSYFQHILLLLSRQYATASWRVFMGLLLLDPHKDACKTDLRNSSYENPFDIYWCLPFLFVL